MLAVLAGVLGGACSSSTPVELWVDGLAPQNVRFEVEDLGRPDPQELQRIRARADVDGAALLAPASCREPCRAALVSVYVHNRSAQLEPPPVVRLEAPPGRPRRLPIAFTGADISPARVGRIRWLVELWPEEQRLVATVSSSVRLDVLTPPVSQEKTQ